MKTFKRTMAIMITCVMALTLCLATALTAFAANETYKITIDSKDKTVHTYNAYQIFSGEVSGTANDKALSNIEWGTGIANGDTLLAALKAETNKAFGETNPFAAVTSASDVADVLAGATFTDEQVMAFADFVKPYLSTVNTNIPCSNATATDANKTYEKTGVAPGYYIIQDETNEGTLANSAFSRNILEVVGDVTLTSKEVLPKLDKVIVENPGKANEAEVKGNVATRGETITFRLKSEVPDMTGYDWYYFIMKDTLSNGLTFNEDSVVVKIGNNTLTSPTDYEVKFDEATNTFKVVFNNFVERTENPGTAITVEYTAVLNNDSIIGGTGNLNTADLTYSNNPSVKNGGVTPDPENPKDPPNDPEDPEDPNYPNDSFNPPTGVTPPSQTKTYTAAIELDKKGENGVDLDGVKFLLEGNSLKVTYVTEGKFIRDDEDGTYWLLKDGSYTTQDPNGNINGEPVDQSTYANVNQKYTKVTSSDSVYETAYVEIVQVTTDGKIIFKGLGNGTYTITELETVDGYNLLKTPITVTIEGTVDAKGDITWNNSASGENTTMKSEATDATVIIEVLNTKGPQLPTTGGIGTRMFYLIGGLLAAGSAIYLITRKRMSVKEN